MDRWTRSTVLVAVAFAGALGCLGEDVSSSTSEPPPGDRADASTPPVEAGAPEDAGAGDAAPTPTCWGARFDEVTLLATTGWDNAVYGPRQLGSEAIFAAMPSGTEQRLYRAPWPGALDGGTPTLAFATSTAVTLGAGPYANSPWAPTPLPDGSLVLAANFTGEFYRRLAVASASGGGWTTPTGILASGGQDDADPWFVGTTAGGALYFSRGPASGTGTGLWRSAVTFAAGPTFAAPQAIALACPAASCGTPVVAPDERRMLFSAITNTTPYAPTVKEARLSNTSGAFAATEIIAHDELGGTYPSWVSADGCTATVAGQPNGAPWVSAVSIVRRKPR